MDLACRKIVVKNVTCVEEAALAFFDTIETRFGKEEKNKLMRRTMHRRLFAINEQMLRVPEDKIYYRWESKGTYAFYY